MFQRFIKSLINTLILVISRTFGGFFSVFKHVTYSKKTSNEEALKHLELKINENRDACVKISKLAAKVRRYLILIFFLFFLPLMFSYTWSQYSISSSIFLTFLSSALVWLPLYSACSYATNYWLARKDEEMTSLLAEKRKVIDIVMETETYKNANMLLEKYAPELSKTNSKVDPKYNTKDFNHNSTTFSTPSATLLKHHKPAGKSPVMTSSQSNTPVSMTSSVNTRMNDIRAVTISNAHEMVSANRNVMPDGSFPPHFTRQETTTSQDMKTDQSVDRTDRLLNRPRPLPNINPVRGDQQIIPRYLPMARPIVDRDRSLIQKVIDTVLGESMNNQYALICSECHSHNGMALQEEFMYISFRCCYCAHWNGPRRNRPFAPPIEVPSSSHHQDSGEVGSAVSNSNTHCSNEIKNAIVVDDTSKHNVANEERHEKDDPTNVVETETLGIAEDEEAGEKENDGVSSKSSESEVNSSE